MKARFTLIELLVALAIGGLLAAMLMNTYFQVNNSAQLVTDTADMQMRSSVLFHQLEKDLRGAYIPSSVLAALHKNKQSQNDEQEEDKKSLISRVFVSSNKDGDTLEQLTFITDNPLVVYWGEKVGKPHTHQARVIYQVIEEPGDEVSLAYRLTRYESTKLSSKTNSDSSGIEIANNIKSIKLTYRARIEDLSDKEDDKSEKKEEKIEEKNTWNTDEQVASTGEEQRIYLPNLVLVDLELWAEGREYSEEFSYAVPLEIESAPVPGAVQKRPPKKKKEEKKAKGSEQESKKIGASEAPKDKELINSLLKKPDNNL